MALILILGADEAKSSTLRNLIQIPGSDYSVEVVPRPETDQKIAGLSSTRPDVLIATVKHPTTKSDDAEATNPILESENRIPSKISAATASDPEVSSAFGNDRRPVVMVKIG